MGFARGAWRFLVGVKDMLVLLLLLLFFGLLWAALNQRTIPSVPSGSALVLDLDGSIVDQATARSLSSVALGGDVSGEIQARDIISAIDAAAADGKIKALVLDLDTFLGAGQANLQSIGSAIDRFRKAGKQVDAFATAYTDDSYYLAARANRIWLNPLGGVLVSGPGGTGLYFKEALDKLDIDIEVFRVGTYKAAVEPFLRNDASPEAKAADQALVDGLWAEWRRDVSAARPAADFNRWLAGLPQRIAQAGGDQAEAARAAGLIDRIDSRDGFDAAMIETLGAADTDEGYGFKSVRLRRYLAATRGLLPASGPAVGVVYVTGSIVDGEAPRGTAGSTSIADAIAEAVEKQPDLKALVVRIDSGGGSVLASEDIRQALLAAKAGGLPLVASFGPVAASGGYWVATAADAIYAQPSTITGSIGVFAVLPSFPRALSRLGIGTDGVKSTPYSGEPNVLGGLGSETRALLQMGVEDAYWRFVTLVAQTRKLPVEEVDKVAQGRVWTGTAAKQLKLVDTLGGLDAAVADAARRGGIEGEVRVINIEPSEPAILAVLESLTESESGEAGVRLRDPFAKLVLAGRQRLMASIGDLQLLGGGATMQAACLGCASMGSPRPALAAKAEAGLTKLLPR